jgi:hypothetical protein
MLLKNYPLFPISKIYFLIAFLSIITIFSCSKKNNNEVTLAEVKGSATINGAFSTFTRADFYILQEGTLLKNYITLARSNNAKIRIIFYGTEEGERVVGTDSLTLEYVDANQRVFRSDSGKVVIDEYSIRDGLFKVSGGFYFVSEYPEVLPETTIIVKTTVENGAFININNN